MYVKTSKDTKTLTVAVPQNLSWTSKRQFNIIPNAIDILGEEKTGIQCSILLGSSAIGGLILSKSYSKAHINSLKIHNDNGDQFIILDDKKYYFSLLKRIGEPEHGPAYWLVDNGETLTYYYGNDLNPKQKVFKDVPSEIFYDLLSAYPKLEKGSAPAFLNALFPVCQEGIRQQYESRQTHLHHAEQRSYLKNGSIAMTEVAGQILNLLKGCLVS